MIPYSNSNSNSNYVQCRIRFGFGSMSQFLYFFVWCSFDFWHFVDIFPISLSGIPFQTRQRENERRRDTNKKKWVNVLFEANGIGRFGHIQQIHIALGLKDIAAAVRYDMQIPFFSFTISYIYTIFSFTDRVNPWNLNSVLKRVCHCFLLPLEFFYFSWVNFRSNFVQFVSISLAHTSSLVFHSIFTCFQAIFYNSLPIPLMDSFAFVCIHFPNLIYKIFRINKFGIPIFFKKKLY